MKYKLFELKLKIYFAAQFSNQIYFAVTLKKISVNQENQYVT